MTQYKKRSNPVDVVQFNYVDEIDGPKTCELATSLGLSRNGSSKLWEIFTCEGWRITKSGWYIIHFTNSFNNPTCMVRQPKDFILQYELDLAPGFRFLKEALIQIAKRKGPYNRDNLTHAENVIENMAKIAEKALDMVSSWTQTN